MTTAPSEVSESPDLLGRRILAGFIDIFIATVIWEAIGLLPGTSSMSFKSLAGLENVGTLIWLAAVVAYYYGCEAATGQTIGKRFVGIRVTSDGGTDASHKQIAIRTLLRLVDGLPLLYGLGLLVILGTGDRRKRLGDLAGRTTVVIVD
jgi:uncharacterized RDD family membrane protein YckC